MNIHALEIWSWIIVGAIIVLKNTLTNIPFSATLGFLFAWLFAVLVLSRILSFVFKKMKKYAGKEVSTAVVVVQIIYLLLFFSAMIFYSDTENKNEGAVSLVEQPPVEQKKQQTITNPDYLKNPSDYLVDYDGKISETIPLNQMLWVEDVYSDHAFTVSYVSEKLGTKFIGLGVIQIPGLGYPLTEDLNVDDFSGDPFEINKWKSSVYGQCWTQGTLSFLETNTIHKAIYMIPLLESPINYTKLPGAFRPQSFAEMFETYRLLMDTQKTGEGQDVSTFLVWNGYAVASESDFISTEQGRTAYNNMVKAKQKFRQELKDMEEVASLEGRGLWGTCKK